MRVDDQYTVRHDINALMQLLAPDVTLWTDGGGKVRQAMRPIVGVEKVAALIAGVAKRPYEGLEIADMTCEVVDINGGPGVVLAGADRVIATFTVDSPCPRADRDHPQRRQSRQAARDRRPRRANLGPRPALQFCQHPARPVRLHPGKPQTVLQGGTGEERVVVA